MFEKAKWVCGGYVQPIWSQVGRAGIIERLAMLSASLEVWLHACAKEVNNTAIHAVDRQSRAIRYLRRAPVATQLTLLRDMVR